MFYRVKETLLGDLQAVFRVISDEVSAPGLGQSSSAE